MSKQTFTTGQVLLASQLTSLQQTAMGGGSATAKTASYVLVAADAGGTVIMNAAGSTTITVNTSLFAAGDTVLIMNIGAGTCTVTAGTATVSTAGSLALTQYESGILYFTATGAAIFNDYVQAGSNPLTTTGDMIYSSSGSTQARLAIGSTSQVLTVAAGIPSWATPGGAYTLINSGGTTLTGSSVTIGSIPATYKDLYLVVSNYKPSAAALLQMRYNSSSTANTYYHIQGTVFGSVVSNTAFDQAQCRLGAMEQNTTTSYSLFQHRIFDYSNTNVWKHSWGTFVTNGVANAAQFNWAPMANVWSNTNAISSIDLFPNTGTFTSGTAYLYGVK